MRMSLVRIRSCWIKVDPKFDTSGVFTREDTLARAERKMALQRQRQNLE